ncbi:MAG: DUF4159 domain-containing protein [Rhodothermales bacterium]
MRHLAIISLLILGLLVPVNTSIAQGDYGFQFVRVRYDSGGGGGFRGFGGAPWRHDWPTAEQNLYEALKRTTNIHVEGEPLVLTLDDERIFEHPLLYLSEPGYWHMSEEEVETLREYLKRGGFILFDDFGGQPEWENLVYQMKRIFPDRDFVDIPPDHPIWDIYYDIDPVEAPSNVSPRWGRAYGKYDDQYLALLDDDGRMVALSCFNQDIGDGWEWPDQNLEQASTISFQMGINFVMYALTH